MTKLLITDHAVERARQRYGLVHISRSVIRDDVTFALRAGRGGRTIPTFPDQRPPTGNAIYVWTPNHERIYVVVGVRTRRSVWLRVITALPGRWSVYQQRPLRRAA